MLVVLLRMADTISPIIDCYLVFLTALLLVGKATIEDVYQQHMGLGNRMCGYTVGKEPFKHTGKKITTHEPTLLVRWAIVGYGS